MTTPRLKEKFKNEVCPKIKEQFGIDNPMALPKLEKIVLNVGLGKQLEGTKVNATAKEQVLADLATISGQKAVMVKAKKSVSNFKVRAGYETGAMVTLRGSRMWTFFDRLIAVAIPRIKDFRGLKDNSFDGRGNYSFGITEQGIFPEIDMANAKFLHGMNITFVFKNSTNEITKEALKTIGMPFVKRDEA
ncbi:MAG: 50S ribosomal protein L5 [Phycisphaeraceae bacterium]|nr:50S ribosomal protein L5 [Phycisphaeraceae bacterium]